jgi:hypothetical protein
MSAVICIFFCVTWMETVKRFFDNNFYMHLMYRVMELKSISIRLVSGIYEIFRSKVCGRTTGFAYLL